MDAKVTMTDRIIAAYRSGRYKSHQEIADYLGVPEKQVKTTKRRIEKTRNVTFAKLGDVWTLIDEDDTEALEAEQVRRLKFAEKDEPAAQSLKAGKLEVAADEKETADDDETVEDEDETVEDTRWAVDETA